MDAVHDDVKEANGFAKKPLFEIDSGKMEDPNDEKEDDTPEDQIDGEEDSESRSLLGGGVSRKPEKSRRKVQWKDNIGNELTQVLVYEPSEAGDSEDEVADSCFCTIM